MPCLFKTTSRDVNGLMRFTDRLVRTLGPKSAQAVLELILAYIEEKDQS